MKSLALILLLAFVGPSLAWSASVSGSLKGLNIKSCTAAQKKCFALKTDQALMSQFLPIYTFKNFNLDITENKLRKNIQGTFGYIDFVSRQIVVRKDQSTADYTINMDSLIERDFSL